MSKFVDMRPFLETWPYDPDHHVRIVVAPDGREVMQVRTPLGMEQYELEGRPDGRRPHGAESALAYHRQRLASARAAGKETPLRLTSAECAELFEEGTLYYFRYLHLFELGQWSRVVRDTARNLGLFDFVREHARRKEDRVHLEKWRPYILRMKAVAGAQEAMEQGDYSAAVARAEAGLEAIQNLDDLEDEVFQTERDRAEGVLRGLALEIEQRRPISELERLERDLQRAIQEQAFEQAAQLRDRIRALRASASGPA